MSRIDELKKQYKEFALSDMDIMKMVVPNQANKYAEMLAKLTRNHVSDSYSSNREDGMVGLRKEILQLLVSNYEMDYAYLETLETLVLLSIYLRIDSIIGSTRTKLFLKFANLNERGLISNNDVTSYKSFSEVEAAVSLAEMKLIDKELEKQIIKVYEDDKWLLLKPLSLEASMKYGANTKWCTTMDSGVYFARYSKWGILIYALNKQTGYKFASFKNLDNNRDSEFSFWNPSDAKIDPLTAVEIPTNILAKVINEVRNNVISNKDLMPKEIQDKIYQEEEVIQEQSTLTFRSTGTGTLTVNPTYYTTTNIIAGTNSTYTTSGTIGMGTTTPNTQLAINGDLEVAGDIRMVDNEGVERMRITSNGFEMPGVISSEAPVSHSYNHYEEQLEQTRSEMFGEIEQRLEQVQEQVVEHREQERDTLLRDIELGTLSEEYKARMQQLAGIDINGVTVKLNGVEIVDDEEAEQTDIPSEQPVNWFNKLKNKIKNGYERITKKSI
jgi:hypothetical protein